MTRTISHIYVQSFLSFPSIHPYSSIIIKKKSSIINLQSSIPNHQSSIINHQSSIFNHQSPIINLQSINYFQQFNLTIILLVVFLYSFSFINCFIHITEFFANDCTEFIEIFWETKSQHFFKLILYS